jgi:hypothetical protein
MSNDVNMQTQAGEQVDQVAAMLARACADGYPVFDNVLIRKDCFGMRRFVTALRSS